MARSAVERLPKDIRDQLEAWLREFIDGRLQLDEVMTRLDAQFADQLGEELPSRSAVHRHSQKFASLAAKMKESRDIANQMVGEYGPSVADGQGFKVLVELFHSMAFSKVAAMGPDETLDMEELMFFARSIGAVASAQKTDTDRALKVRALALKDAAKAAEQVAKSEGISKDTLDKIRAGILGVKV